jgi:CO dehydrogenase nickel-insertion accessory protein CooC1
MHYLEIQIAGRPKSGKTFIAQAIKAILEKHGIEVEHIEAFPGETTPQALAARKEKLVQVLNEFGKKGMKIVVREVQAQRGWRDGR